MGIQKRVRSIRTSEQENSMWSRLQDAFSPFVRNFSETVNLCGRLVWKMLSTPGMLADIVSICQQLQCNTTSDQLKIHFPPEVTFRPRLGKFPSHAAPDKKSVSATQGGLGAHAHVLSQHPTAGAVAAEAWAPPFFGRLRRAFISEGSTRRLAS